MLPGLRRVFAGRGIALPPFRITAVVVVAALVLGLGAGWVTEAVTQAIKAANAPKEAVSEGPDAQSTATPVIPSMDPITRELTQSDRDAGITTTEFPLNGEGTFTVVAGKGEPTTGGGDVRWISVSVEDGIDVDAAVFQDFVLDTLNDARGWGSNETLQYVATDGAADFRIVLASPATAATLCPEPHVGAAPLDETDASASADAASATASPSASAEPEEEVVLCHDDAAAIISIYDWIAGYKSFAKDYTAARVYLLNHHLGHLMGKEDVECAGGRADIMVNQDEALAEGCEVNPWPYPDAVPADEATASPTTSDEMP